VKAKYLTVFVRAFGWMEFSSVESRTGRAVEGLSPAWQIRSVNASIFSSLEATKVVDDAFGGVNATHAFG